MFDLKRLNEESAQEYQFRICDNRDKYGLNWVEVAEVLNKEFDQKYGESKYRKEFAAFKAGVEHAKEKAISTDEALFELEQKRVEAEKATVRLRDQRREYKKDIRDVARVEKIHDDLRAEMQRLAEVKPMIRDWTPYKASDREGLVVLSDWHFGMTADNYWNTFNPEVFYQRVSYLKEKVIQYGLENNIKKLHVATLGDMVSGFIHETIRIENAENTAVQTMRVSEVISEFVNALSEYFVIEYYNVRGNHDRITPKKNLSLASESFMDIIHWYVQSRLENNKNVTFHKNEIDEEICTIRIFDQLLYGVHGHKDRPQSVVENLTLMTGVKPSAILMAHRHHHFEKEVHGVDIIQNGCLGGIEEFAKDIRTTSKAHQKFMVFEKGIGRLSTYNIVLN